MNIQEFVSELKRIGPTKEEYISFGFSEGLAERLAMEYTFLPSERLIESYDLLSDDIVRLIRNFDGTGVQIGLITFMSNVEVSDGFVYFGNVEMDVLSISKATLEVVVLDHDNLDWIIWPCAASSSHFLNALLVFADFLSYKVKNKVVEYNALEINECALLCSEKAGGEKYLEFYKMLLGYEE